MKLNCRHFIMHSFLNEKVHSSKAHKQILKYTTEIHTKISTCKFNFFQYETYFIIVLWNMYKKIKLLLNNYESKIFLSSTAQNCRLLAGSEKFPKNDQTITNLKHTRNRPHTLQFFFAYFKFSSSPSSCDCRCWRTR
jgi:hypothetical protein